MAHIASAPAKSDKQYYGATGKRKTAIARVKLIPSGTGKVVVNDLKINEYFAGVQIENAVSPLVITSTKDQFDVEAVLLGGGKSAQSDALRHGISRALLLLNPEYRPQLKAAGYLRRDSRIKERKKPGLKRARRAPQWQKR
jgi:small subunit ribosomal protein S9